MQSLHHRSILPIYGVYRGRRCGSVYMVTELYETTLEELLSLKYPLSLVGVSGRVEGRKQRSASCTSCWTCWRASTRRACFTAT